MERGNRKPAAELGLLDAITIGMRAMIGAGIFVLTGLAAQISGPAAIFVFVLNGIVTAFTGLSYAELASAIPKSGGGYAFVREIYDDLQSFVMGWMLWFAYTIAGAVYALGFAPNFLELLHVYGFVPPPEAIGDVALPVVPATVPADVGLAFGAVFSTLTALNAVVMLGSIVLPTASAGNMSSLFFLLSFIVVNGAVVKLRRERPNMRRPYEIPYYPIPPVLGIVLNLALTVVLVRYLLQTDQLALLLSLVWIVLGVIAYFVFDWLRSSRTTDKSEASEKPKTVTESPTEETD